MDPTTPPPPPPAGTDVPAPVGSSAHWWTLLPILLVFVWTAYLTFGFHPISAESFGFWIGTLIIPVVLACLIARAWKHGRWVRFCWWFFAFGLVIPAISHQSSPKSVPPAELMKEIVGTKPVDNNLPEDEREEAEAMKGFVSDVKEQRKVYSDQMMPLAPELRKLYSAGSFASKDAMQRASKAVYAGWALDRDFSGKIEQWPAIVQTRLDKTSLSDSAKKSFMQSFRQSFASSEFLAARQEMMAAESDRAEATIDLYTFSLQHQSQIIVADNRIRIATESVRNQFNTKLKNAENLNHLYIAAGKKAAAIRTANMEKYGVKPEDFGLTQ